MKVAPTKHSVVMVIDVVLIVMATKFSSFLVVAHYSAVTMGMEGGVNVSLVMILLYSFQGTLVSSITIILVLLGSL